MEKVKENGLGINMGCDIMSVLHIADDMVWVGLTKHRMGTNGKRMGPNGKRMGQSGNQKYVE